MTSIAPIQREECSPTKSRPTCKLYESARVREDSGNTPKIQVTVNLSGERNNYSSDARLPRDLGMHMGTVSNTKHPPGRSGPNKSIFLQYRCSQTRPTAICENMRPVWHGWCLLLAVLLGLLATRYHQTNMAGHHQSHQPKSIEIIALKNPKLTI